VSDDVEPDLKELLHRRADDMRLPPGIPPITLRRARRRRGWSATFAGVTAIAVVAGTITGIQFLTRSTPNNPSQTNVPTPTPTGPVVSAEELSVPPVWPAGSIEELRFYEREVEQGRETWLLDPWETTRRFAFDVLGWRSSDLVVTLSHVSDGGETHAFVSGATIGYLANADTEQRVELVHVGSSQPIWMVTGASSNLFTVRCPAPGAQDIDSRTPLHVCGEFDWTPQNWTVASAVEPPDTALAANEATDGTDLPVTGWRFDGDVPLPATSGGDQQVAVQTRLFGRDGTTIGLDIRRVTAHPGNGVGNEPGLTDAAAATRSAILDAAGADSYDQLRSLIPNGDFSFTFGDGGQGDTVADAAITYWKEQGFEPLRIMAALLEMPYTTVPLEGGVMYEWPAIATWTPKQLRQIDEIAPEWRSALEQIYPNYDEALQGWIDYGGYVGWRIGIGDDGRWRYFVSGD